MATVKEQNSLKVAGKHGSDPSRALATYREANSQTFVSGAYLKMSVGLVAEATSGGATGEVSPGIAMQDGQNVTTKPRTQVAACLPGRVFSGVLGNSADDLFTLRDNRADVGRFAKLLKDAANGGWYLDATTASTTIFNGARVRIVGVVDEDAPLTGNTAVNPRVYFAFLPEGREGAADERSTIYS